jgi:hypothetical protein
MLKEDAHLRGTKQSSVEEAANKAKTLPGHASLCVIVLDYSYKFGIFH